MSDERDTRDGGNAGGSTDDAPVSRPTGKRSTRRVRPGGETESSAAQRGAVATKSRPTPKQSAASAPQKENIFKRVRRFLREVIAELKKVIWPNRKQMITYTTIVLVFVIFMVAFIGGLDLALGKGVSWLFG